MIKNNQPQTTNQGVKMIGTEKQIEWAEEIRNDLLSNIWNDGIDDQIDSERRAIDRRWDRGKSTEKNEAKIHDLEILREKITTEQDAVWFIENCDAMKDLWSYFSTRKFFDLTGVESVYRELVSAEYEAKNN